MKEKLMASKKKIKYCSSATGSPAANKIRLLLGIRLRIRIRKHIRIPITPTNNNNNNMDNKYKKKPIIVENRVRKHADGGRKVFGQNDRPQCCHSQAGRILEMRFKDRITEGDLAWPGLAWA